MVLGKPRQVAYLEVCDERTYFGLEIKSSYCVVFGVHHLIRPPSLQVEFEYIMEGASIEILSMFVLNSSLNRTMVNWRCSVTPKM